MESILKINLNVTIEHLEEDVLKIYKLIFPNTNCNKKLILNKMKNGFINLIYKCYFEDDEENSFIIRIFSSKINFERIREDNEKLVKKGKEDQLKKEEDQPMKEDQSKQEDQTKQEENQPNKDDQLKQDNSTGNLAQRIMNFEQNIFNRTFENKIMFEASKKNLCRPIYCSFNNGMCYNFAKGVTLTSALMLTNDYLEVMSKKLAAFHQIDLVKPNISGQTYYESFGKMSNNFVNEILKQLDTSNKRQTYPYNKYPNIDEILRIQQLIKSKLEEIGCGEIGFCHNDLNQNNIIWQPDQNDLRFIDFEQSAQNYIAADLGQHFLNYAGQFLDEFNKDYFPKISYRIKFIESYLKERYRLLNKTFDQSTFNNEINLLFIRSNLFSIYYIVLFILLPILFDLKHEYMSNERLDEIRKKKSNPGGQFGLQVYELYKKYKDELLSFSYPK